MQIAIHESLSETGKHQHYSPIKNNGNNYESLNPSYEDYESQRILEIRNGFNNLFLANGVTEKSFQKYFGNLDWDWTYSHKFCFDFDKSIAVPIRKNTVSEAVLIYFTTKFNGERYLIINKKSFESVVFCESPNDYQTNLFKNIYEIFSFIDHDGNGRHPHSNGCVYHSLWSHFQLWFPEIDWGGSGGGGGNYTGGGSFSGGIPGGGSGGIITTGLDEGPNSQQGGGSGFCDAVQSTLGYSEFTIYFHNFIEFEEQTSISEVNGISIIDLSSPICSNTYDYEEFKECLIISIGCHLGIEPDEVEELATRISDLENEIGLNFNNSTFLTILINDPGANTLSDEELKNLILDTVLLKALDEMPDNYVNEDLAFSRRTLECESFVFYEVEENSWMGCVDGLYLSKGVVGGVETQTSEFCAHFTIPKIRFNGQVIPHGKAQNCAAWAANASAASCGYIYAENPALDPDIYNELWLKGFQVKASLTECGYGQAINCENGDCLGPIQPAQWTDGFWDWFDEVFFGCEE